MFRNAYQHGRISLLYSCGSSPLELWNSKVANGYIRRVVDQDVGTLALEITGSNVSTCYITCPKDPKATLGIKMQYFVMIIKNMLKYFTFEITILDDKNIHRRFRLSNFQSTTSIRHFCTMMPIGLNEGWNQVQFNLSDFTRRAYGSTYLETTKIQIHANCRIRRIYFADRLYPDNEIPDEYRLYTPVRSKTRPSRKGRRASSKVAPDVAKPSDDAAVTTVKAEEEEKQIDDASSVEAQEASDSEDAQEITDEVEFPEHPELSDEEAQKEDEEAPKEDEEELDTEAEKLEQSQQHEDDEEYEENVLLTTI